MQPFQPRPIYGYAASSMPLAWACTWGMLLLSLLQVSLRRGLEYTRCAFGAVAGRACACACACTRASMIECIAIECAASAWVRGGVAGSTRGELVGLVVSGWVHPFLLLLASADCCLLPASDCVYKDHCYQPGLGRCRALDEKGGRMEACDAIIIMAIIKEPFRSRYTCYAIHMLIIDATIISNTAAMLLRFYPFVPFVLNCVPGRPAMGPFLYARCCRMPTGAGCGLRCRRHMPTYLAADGRILSGFL